MQKAIEKIKSGFNRRRYIGFVLIAFLLLSSCSQKPIIVRVPISGKLPVLSLPTPPDPKDYTVVHPYKKYKAGKFGAVCLNQRQLLSLKLYLASLRNALDKNQKLIEEHNRLIDEAMSKMTSQGGWNVFSRNKK